MPTLPEVNSKHYTADKWGVFGQLGEGANAKVQFVQTTISPNELGDITLISNIPGSEHWDVRDLFQRDVDDARVGQEIIPYLKEPGHVKFFNPLTLIILPMQEDGKRIVKEVVTITPGAELEGGQNYITFERDGYYKLGILEPEKVFAKVQWNKNKCHIVAIDGQHRLSALQRLKNSLEAHLIESWKIPVVILTISKVTDDEDAASLLEIVRKTFVNINKKAERINPAREILLDDESVNAIGTQELIQLSHGNDIKTLDRRNPEILPLIFFDWRGETKNLRRVPGPASVKDVIEIHAWFEHYLIGEDGGSQQKSELGLTDLVPPLANFGSKKDFSHDNVKRIREQFKNTILPGLGVFLQGFTPYKGYVSACRKAEQKALVESDIAQHAFTKLRFGTHNAPVDQQAAVETKFNETVAEFTRLKGEVFPEILEREIGMRGIVYAYGEAKRELFLILQRRDSWEDYSRQAVVVFNEIYADGWFGLGGEPLPKDKELLLTHLIRDESGDIINYKLDAAKNSFGCFLLLLFFSKLSKNKDPDFLISEIEMTKLWNKYEENLRKPLAVSFRKKFKAAHRLTRGTQPELKGLITKETEAAIEKKLLDVQKLIGVENDDA